MSAYLILDLSIKNFGRFSEYIEMIPAFIKKHGGHYVVQGVVPETIEGEWHPERVVIIEFPSKVAAKSFLSDPDAQPLFELRHQVTNSRLILAEGCL